MGLEGGTTQKRLVSPLTTLLNAIVFNAATTSQNSDGVDCAKWDWFSLWLTMQSANTPTTIQFIPQFSNDDGTTWFSFLQDMWAAAFWEDTVMATQINEVYYGRVVGNDFRLRAVAVGTTATNTFTVTAKVQFWR